MKHSAQILTLRQVMKAAADNHAWKACAIEKDVKYVYFKRIIRKKIKYRTEVKAEDW